MPIVEPTIEKFEKAARDFAAQASERQIKSVFRGFGAALGDCLFAAQIALDQHYPIYRIRAGNGSPASLVFSKITFIGVVGDDADLVDVSRHAICSQSSNRANVNNGAAGAIGKLYTCNVHTLKEIDPWWQAEFPENVRVRHVLFFRRFDRHIVNDRNIQLLGVDPSGSETVLHSPQSGEVSRPPLSDALVNAFSALQQLAAELSGEGRKFDDTLVVVLKCVTAAMANAVSGASSSSLFAEASASQLADDMLKALHAALGRARDFGVAAEDGLDIDLEGVQARHVRFRCYGALPRGMGGAELYSDESNVPFARFDKSALKFVYRAPACSSPESCAIGLTNNIPSRRVDLGEVHDIRRLKIWNLDDMDAANTLFLEVAVRQDSDDPWKVVYDHGAPYRNVCKAIKLVDLLIGGNWTPPYARLLGKMFTQYRRRPIMRPVARFVRGYEELRKAIFEGSNEVSRTTRYAAPLRLGKHGLGVPIAFRDTKTVMGHLVEMRDKIKKLGHTPLFMYGTLLGAIREKDFIPHDDDVDLAIIMDGVGPTEINAECDRFIETLNQNGVKANRGVEHGPLIHCHRGPVTYDIFLFAHVDDTIHWMHKELKTVPERADIFLPTGTIEFKGETFDAPNNPEAVCEARYGADWRVPNAAFEW